MSSNNIIKHVFEWKPFHVSRLVKVHTKTFEMRVFDADVRCVAVLNQSKNRFERRNDNLQTLSYELEWDGSEDRPLFYTCDVRIRDYIGNVVWSERKASPDGSHVDSFEVFPRGVGSSQDFKVDPTKKMYRYGGRVDAIEFAFEFVQRSDFKRMLAAELALPLFREGVFSDVVVVCGERTFECHKIVLAGRSEVFRAMLTGSFREAHENRIEIKDCASEVARALIEFLYSDEVAEDAVSWELFELAKMYDLPRLRCVCLRGLRKNLNEDNCDEMFEAAIKHGLEDFVGLAVNFGKKSESEEGKLEDGNAGEQQSL